MQLQMECCDLDGVDFVQYTPHGFKSRAEVLDIVQVHRDADWWATHFPMMEAFHRDVQEYRQTGRAKFELPPPEVWI